MAREPPSIKMPSIARLPSNRGGNFLSRRPFSFIYGMQAREKSLAWLDPGTVSAAGVLAGRVADFEACHAR